MIPTNHNTGAILYETTSSHIVFEDDKADIDWKETAYTLALETDNRGRTTEELYLVYNADHDTKNSTLTNALDDNNENQDEDAHISLCSMPPPFTIAKVEFPFSSLFRRETNMELKLKELSHPMPEIYETTVIEMESGPTLVGLFHD
jgi:hypothetical protein